MVYVSPPLNDVEERVDKGKPRILNFKRYNIVGSLSKNNQTIMKNMKQFHALFTASRTHQHPRHPSQTCVQCREERENRDKNNNNLF